MQITKTFEVELTPEQLAEEFWEMDAGQQARFFNHLFEQTPEYWLFQKQMAAVHSSTALETGGRAAMLTIGDKPKCQF